MKLFFPTLLLSLQFLSALSQVYSGLLINAENGQPVPFANIGIIGQNAGTVSDAAGSFRLELNSRFDNETLRISCIGYEGKSWLIGDFKREIVNIDKVRIELSPVSYQLDEVVIRPVDTQTYTLGNFCDPNSAYGNAFYSTELGTEMGVVMQLPRKKNTAYLKSFRFYVGEFTFGTFPVRLNIYSLKDGRPHENILTEPVFLDITSEGEYITDLKKYNIVTEGDFFISLEYYRIPDHTEGTLTFCAVHNRQKNKGNSFYRLTSQGNWVGEMFDRVGFSVEVECEK
ncbi:MAG: carboxypeptidase-like regulatory domain-containing protein [Bacteroidales bacterium]|nr:carboxypeptidase-like regulatory domain-containing protein [Bacteroidales bacterium]